jgi:hypothetical protein
MFKGGSWKPHFDLDDVWVFNSSELKNVDLQINWNSSEDWGDIGFQIADEYGNEIYTGKDPKKAAASIKKLLNESTINESVYPTKKGGPIENSLRSEEIGRLNLKYKGDIIGTLLVWMKPGYIFGDGGSYDENYWEVGASYTSYPMRDGGRFSDGSTGSGVWGSSGYKSKDDAIKAGKEFMKNIKLG